MDYLIIPKTSWRVSAQDLSRHLLSRWPDTHIRVVQNPERTESLEFALPMSHSELTGSLDGQGRYVSFVGDIRDVAEFALWLRSLAPASEQLFFGDEGMPTRLELETGTTSADIFNLYDYTPPPTPNPT